VPIEAKDRTVLRDLAQQLAEAAAQPVMDERRAMWKRHNRLERVRPLVMVFPEGSWRELLPQSALICEGERAREIEWHLRLRLFYRDVIPDDSVIEAEWIVPMAIGDTGWGIEGKQKPSAQAEGAWAFDPVITKPSDLDKLHFPEVHYDHDETQRRYREMRDLLGDILDVKLKGIAHISFHLLYLYTRWRGLEQVMLDMYEEPQMLHDAMAFLEEGHHRLVKQYQDMGLFSLNNDATYQSTGGFGYTTELPLEGHYPNRITPADMWASAEAQEFAAVSPEMHEEFALQYERRLLAPFGLNGYGCCEDLTGKLDLVLTIPNIRRISISPFADVERCAERLGSKAIFSWKPHPSHLVGDFNPAQIRDYIRHTLEVTRGCIVEMSLKDTHTCEHRPERFTQWTQIARDLAEDY
jgi:hypothetical protein